MAVEASVELRSLRKEFVTLLPRAFP